MRERIGNAQLALALLCLNQACDAAFVDRRPEPNQGADARPSADGAERDAPAVGEDGVFAEGAFEGRGGYVGHGTARLLREAGEIVLELAEDFETSSVPGPVVVLSSREAIGTAIDPQAGDLELGTLEGLSGQQRYELPGEDEGRRYAWVYCKPFGVEVARALLNDLP